METLKNCNSVDDATSEMTQIARNMVDICAEQLRQSRDLTRNLSLAMSASDPQAAERLGERATSLEAKIRRMRQ